MKKDKVEKASLVMGVIKERMRFETYNDFYLRKNIIRDMFKELSRDEQEIYRYYVYANRILSDTKADRIWEFLAAVDSEEFFQSVDNLKRYYNKGGDGN